MVEPREGEVNIQIGNSLFDSYQNLKIEKRLNEVDTFEFTAFITDDADRGLISEGQDILVFEDQEFVFKGRIEDTDYSSSFEVKVEGEGMATKLLDRKTDRDSFDNTPADQITQQIIPLDTVSEGVIEEAPLTSLSFDHDNIARAVAGAANAVGFDWQLRQEEVDGYDTDFVDFRERIGSGTVVETFKIGENARLVENEQDDGFVANDITLLGRGDGINQLEARVFAAANEFTQLQAEISEDQTNNFTVDDTTVLGDTGDTIVAKVGAELINCTIEDATTLSINERGVENWEGEETPQILHRENISVWLYENITQGLGPYTPENQGSAQEGSSIADKGVKQLRETDKTVVKLPTLEQVADRELRNRFRSVQSVRVRTAEPRIGSRVELGDEIEVTGDLGTDLSGKYRVVGIDLNRRSSDEGTELICANRPRRLVERLSEIERDRDTLNAHMQGATNFNSESFGDNCDEDNPLRNKFYVPEDVVNINKFELTFARQSFRGYVQNEPHSHDFESFESSDTGEWTNQGMQIINDNVSSVSDPLVFVETPQSPTGEDSGVNITATVFNQDSSVGRSLDLDIVNETTGEVLKSESFTLGPGNLQTFNLTRGSNTVSSGDDIKAEINGNLSTDSFFNSYLHLDVSSKSSHDHEGTVIEGAGEPVYGIFEPTTEADVDVEVIVDGTTIQTVENVSVGEEIDDPVSIVEELDDPLTGRYHTVELRPVQTEGDENGRCRLQADIIQKVFIESTL